MNHTTPCDLTVAPRPDSPALQAAFDAISRDARRTVIELTKSAARGFLALDTRWRLNLLWRGLEVTDPEEALAVLDRVAALRGTNSRRGGSTSAAPVSPSGGCASSRAGRSGNPSRCRRRVGVDPAPSSGIGGRLFGGRSPGSALPLTWPDEAQTYKARARYWLAMAGVARRAESRRLP